MDCDRIAWSDLTDRERIDLIPSILARLRLEVWFYKFDGEPRSLELRTVKTDDQ